LKKRSEIVVRDWRLGEMEKACTWKAGIPSP